MLKQYQITWRYPTQCGHNNHQIFTCSATSEFQAISYFRQKEGFNGKRIITIQSQQNERKY